MLGKCHVLGKQDFDKAVLARAERKKSNVPKAAAKNKQASEGDADVLEGDDEENWPVVMCRYRYACAFFLDCFSC